MLIMQKRAISFSAIFLGVIIVLALLAMCALVGLAINMSVAPDPKDEPIANNIFVLVGFGVVILFSAAFFLAAYIATYFADAREFIERLGHGLGTWALLTFLLSFASITSVGILDLRQSLGAINNPYVSTDVEMLEMRAITRLNITGQKEDNRQIIKQLGKSKHLVLWVSCIAIFVGLGVTFGAAAFGGGSRKHSGKI